MAKVFDKSNIVENLPAIILCSHGPLALGMAETLKMVTGETDNIAVFTLEEGQELDEYRAQIGEAIEAYPNGSVVFVDVLGGTPSNSIMLLSRDKKEVINCIAGFNLPILMQATISRGNQSGKELLETIMDVANGGVCNITSMLEKMI